MTVLLHICCGPCSIMAAHPLLDEGHAVTGFFFNPNIHPMKEYLLRREGAAQAAERLGIEMIWPDRQWGAAAYDTAAWMDMVAGRQRAGERCVPCWGQRLRRTWDEASERGFQAFSTSLLYSRFQPHDQIKALGEDLGAQPGGPAFLYRDFRKGWNEGVRVSKEWGLYRQQYCGCLFSENERYGKEFAALLRP